MRRLKSALPVSHRVVRLDPSDPALPVPVAGVAVVGSMSLGYPLLAWLAVGAATGYSLSGST